MGHQRSDHPLESFPGACQRPGAAAHPLYHPPDGTWGPPRAYCRGRGSPRLGHAAPARAGVTPPPTQATATRPPPPGPAPKETETAAIHPCCLVPHGPSHDHAPAAQPSYSPLSMDYSGGRGPRMIPDHQPPCPGGRLCRIPGLAAMHNGGSRCSCGPLAP